MLLDLIQPKATCFAFRNIQVPVSSCFQGNRLSISIALLLTTFSSFVTTKVVSVEIVADTIVSAKNQMVQFCSPYTEENCLVVWTIE